MFIEFKEKRRLYTANSQKKSSGLAEGLNTSQNEITQ
jgi:hypothetical protein